MAGANVLLSSSRNQEFAIDAMRCKAIAGSPMRECHPSPCGMCGEGDDKGAIIDC
jgi:hypothetical protein